MFNHKKITDERIVNTQNKIYREINLFITTLCAISLIVKMIMGLRGFEYIGIEMTILIFSGVYYIVRSTQLGIYSEEVELKSANSNSKLNSDSRTFLIGIALGVIIGLIFGVNSAIQYADGIVEKMYFFAITFFGSFLFYLPFLLLVLFVPPKIAKYKSDKVNRKMLEEMDDE